MLAVDLHSCLNLPLVQQVELHSFCRSCPTVRAAWRLIEQVLLPKALVFLQPVPLAEMFLLQLGQEILSVVQGFVVFLAPVQMLVVLAVQLVDSLVIVTGRPFWLAVQGCFCLSQPAQCLVEIRQTRLLAQLAIEHLAFAFLQVLQSLPVQPQLLVA